MATEKWVADAHQLLIEIERIYEDHYSRSYNQCVHDIFNAMRRIVRRNATFRTVEVVHSRFVRIADFGDGEGCFGYCERCGTIHHAQHLIALKAGHRWCRWCGAKMDGDGDG